MEKSPSWGIGKESRGDRPADSVRNNFPGPNSYQQQSTNTGPKWGFGSEPLSKA